VTAYRNLPISYIKVGKRYRSDLGDLGPLEDSIREIGLLHPVVVDRLHNLIAGQRRLEAWKRARPDSKAIPAVVVETLDDALARLRAERDENVCRKDMTASELYALGKQIERLERPKAKERQGRRSDLRPATSSSDEEKVATNEKVAEAVGMSKSQWERLKRVGDAAAAGDEAAIEALKAVDSGTKTISRADKDVRERGALPDTVGNLRTITRRKPATHILNRACEQLDGITEMLDKLDFAEVEPAEAERLAASLSRSRPALTRAINQLRSIA
jgi:ParB-like chromosome segregation protein Spo0J